MRRFVTFFVLFLFAIPFGVSISGCSKKATPTFCNGGDSGITTGTVTNITLQPIVFGMSLNYAQIGQVQTPTATDCKGNSASVGSFTYGTTDMTIADVEPKTGKLCGGTWNRNTGGGIPDYTVCNPTNKSGIAYISASAEGATSNPLPVYVHAVVTSIVLGLAIGAVTGHWLVAFAVFVIATVIAVHGFLTGARGPSAGMIVISLLALALSSGGGATGAS